MHTLPLRLLILLGVGLLLALSASACSRHKPGAPCVEESTCPDHLTCAPDRQGTQRCLIPAGSPCDLSAREAFCVPQATCQPTAGSHDGRCLITLAN